MNNSDATKRAREALAQVRGHRETRSLPGTNIETRDDTDSGALVQTGHAVIFDAPPYDIGGNTYEKVQRGAFTRTLKSHETGPDVVYWFGHGEGGALPLARTGAGLTVWEDETGLAFRAELDAEDPAAAALHRAIKRGVVKSTSFAFRTENDTFTDMGDGRQLRTLTTINLHGGDVSPVRNPASPSTTLNARSRDRSMIAIPDYTSRARELLAVLQRGSAGGAISAGRPGPMRAVASNAPDAAQRAREERILKLREGAQHA